MKTKYKRNTALAAAGLVTIFLICMASLGSFELFSVVHFIRGIAAGMTAVALISSLIIFLKKVKKHGKTLIADDPQMFLLLMVFCLSGAVILLLLSRDAEPLIIVSALLAGAAGLLNGLYVRCHKNTRA